MELKVLIVTLYYLSPIIIIIGYASSGSHVHAQAVLPAPVTSKNSHLIKSNSETDTCHLGRALKEQLQFGECEKEDKKMWSMFRDSLVVNSSLGEIHFQFIFYCSPFTYYFYCQAGSWEQSSSKLTIFFHLSMQSCLISVLATVQQHSLYIYNALKRHFDIILHACSSSLDVCAGEA